MHIALLNLTSTFPRGTVDQGLKPKGTKQAKGTHGLDFSFKSEKTALHDKYTHGKSISGGTEQKHRKGSVEDRRESNGLSLPELRKNEGRRVTEDI